MPKVDPGLTIRDAQELMNRSKEVCKRSRLIIEKSKRLEEIFAASHSTFDRARRKHPLKRNATVST
jgi:hypothetical protein